jgi:phospholipid/cholesterol/gamma-HCH transport system permease protein
MGKSSEFYSVTSEGQTLVIALSGRWAIESLPQLYSFFSELSSKVSSDSKLRLDGQKLQEIDTAGSMMIAELISPLQKEKVEFSNFKSNHKNLLDLVCSRLKGDFNPRISHQKPSFIERIGITSLIVYKQLKGFLNFFGRTTYEIAASIRNPRKIRLRELFVQLELSFLNAIPIVVLLTFLIGVVIAYLFASQMERYGANIYIVDAVSRSMCRELSAILVAIVVAGRSGSAFTAQIGTMKLNEEIDAIVTLGLSPFHVLVIPRILALIIAMPILVFIGNIAGIYGGMLIADFYLGITYPTFIARMFDMLPFREFAFGLLKAPVYAAFIAIIGCRMGMICESNARSVGVNTTSTVVQSIVAVILLNAAFAVLYVELGF